MYAHMLYTQLKRHPDWHTQSSRARPDAKSLQLRLVCVWLSLIWLGWKDREEECDRQ